VVTLSSIASDGTDRRASGCATCSTFHSSTFAHTTSGLSDSDIQLLRSDVQAGKNEIITATMQFPDAESTAFWPVYRGYARDQQVIGDERVKLVKDYAASYETLDDNKAKDLVQRKNDQHRRQNIKPAQGLLAHVYESLGSQARRKVLSSG